MVAAGGGCLRLSCGVGGGGGSRLDRGAASLCPSYHLKAQADYEAVLLAYRSEPVAHVVATFIIKFKKGGHGSQSLEHNLMGGR